MFTAIIHSSSSIYSSSLNKFEEISSITTIQRKEKNKFDFKYNSDEFKILQHNTDIPTFTSLILDNKNNALIEDDLYFFAEDYDIVVKRPTFKTITQKVRVKSITPFRPKIVL